MIFNPSAGRLSDADREHVVTGLTEHLDLDVFPTTERNEGIELAEKAIADGHDLVVAFGGDGLVNEVVNAVAGSEASLGIIPGGTMNVFARSLDIPTGRDEAIERVVSGTARSVHLGRMNGRLFTFSAGCGFDAEAAELVETHLTNKRRFGEIYFYWSALRVLAGTYRHRNPSMILRGPFGEVPVSMAVANNTGPYAYFLSRPVRLAPEVRLEGGLDVFALRRMRIEALPFYAFRAAIAGDVSKHKDAFYAHDVEAFELVADEPFHCHVDGEPLEPTDRAQFRISRNALQVIM